MLEVCGGNNEYRVGGEVVLAGEYMGSEGVVEVIQNGGASVGAVNKCEKGKSRGARGLGPAAVRVQLAVVVAEDRVEEFVSPDSRDQVVPPDNAAESGGNMAWRIWLVWWEE